MCTQHAFVHAYISDLLLDSTGVSARPTIKMAIKKDRYYRGVYFQRNICDGKSESQGFSAHDRFERHFNCSKGADKSRGSERPILEIYLRGYDAAKVRSH